MDENDVQNVENKIREFNSALLGGNIIANCKVFVGELRGPNNRKLMQIRCNDYRVLCELGQEKGSTATVVKIFKKSQANKIY